MLAERTKRTRQQARTLNLSDLRRRRTQPRATLSQPPLARPGTHRHTDTPRHYNTPPRGHTPHTANPPVRTGNHPCRRSRRTGSPPPYVHGKPSPREGEPGRRRGARRPALAASRQPEEREREREMRQRQADASSIGPATRGAHPRHVSHPRNHAKPTPSSLKTQSLFPSPTLRARLQPTAGRHDPNQTLCLPGTTTLGGHGHRVS